MNKIIKKPQIVTSPKGEQMVVLARADYDALLARALAADDEDIGTARIVDRTQAAIAAGHDVMLPADVAEAIARGENPLRVIRCWRGMTQADFGGTKIQSTISALENGTRRGTAATWKRLAEVLGVPMNVLIPE